MEYGATFACSPARSGESNEVERALVVSIHDVAPATLPRVEEIVGRLRGLGVGAASLLVVPDYHRQGRAMADAAFREWLRERENEGSEIVLHGFYHQRPRQPNESAQTRVVTRFYTADEGEFFDLPYAEALRLIGQADEEFRSHGFRPRGFVAPAWLLGAEAERAAIDAGMTYTTTLRRVKDFVARQEFASQSLVYSVRSPWRRGVSLGWNRWLQARLTNNPLLRLSLHPPDVSFPKIWKQVSEFVRLTLQDRRSMTYVRWLESVALP